MIHIALSLHGFSVQEDAPYAPLLLGFLWFAVFQGYHAPLHLQGKGTPNILERAWFLPVESCCFGGQLWSVSPRCPLRLHIAATSSCDVCEVLLASRADYMTCSADKVRGASVGMQPGVWFHTFDDSLLAILTLLLWTCHKNVAFDDHPASSKESPQKLYPENEAAEASITYPIEEIWQFLWPVVDLFLAHLSVRFIFPNRAGHPLFPKLT